MTKPSSQNKSEESDQAGFEVLTVVLVKSAVFWDVVGKVASVAYP
jgi:hypothetical protein